MVMPVEPIQELNPNNTSIPFTDGQGTFHTMEPASNSNRMTGSLSNAQDGRMPGTIRPYRDPDASSVGDYYMS